MVVGLGSRQDGMKLVTLGISDLAWAYAADGRTLEVDLRKLGIPAMLMVYGGRDHAHLAGMLEEHNERGKGPRPTVPNVDVGITEGSQSASALKSKFKGSTSIR